MFSAVNRPASYKQSIPYQKRPIRRRPISQNLLLIFVTIIIGTYAYFYEKKMCEICLLVALGLGFFIFLRICLLVQEFTINRHKFNMSQTLELVMEPSCTSLEYQNRYSFWIKFGVFLCAATQSFPQGVQFKDTFDVVILLILIAVGIQLQWHDCALLESHRLEKPFSYSGGSAMAFSFYYGYLKLIAPDLLSRMKHFRDDQLKDHLKLIEKLYILIPSSSFFFDKLEGFQQLTKTKDLKIEHVPNKFSSHKQDRGLVKGRTYKNTMYVVEYSDDETYYILLEGATPVKTFYETCKEQNHFEKNKDEVISAFYYTLKKLIRDNKETKDIIELIYYDDERRNVTIPDIVKERILKKSSKS